MGYRMVELLKFRLESLVSSHALSAIDGHGLYLTML